MMVGDDWHRGFIFPPLIHSLYTSQSRPSVAITVIPSLLFSNRLLNSRQPISWITSSHFWGPFSYRSLQIAAARRSWRTQSDERLHDRQRVTRGAAIGAGYMIISGLLLLYRLLGPLIGTKSGVFVIRGCFFLAWTASIEDWNMRSVFLTITLGRG